MRTKRRWLLPGLAAAAFVACRPPAAEPRQTGKETNAMKLTSKAFEDGKTIPVQHTGDGADVSPPLQWGGAPAATKSFALICDDPDAPMGTWVHWVIYGLPAATKELPEKVAAEESLPSGARQGVNDFRRIGYGGPLPPPGKPHRYFFKLYALDAEPPLKPGATKPELLRAMEGHILAQAQLVGTYRR
jgi:Raf kinase inhibitor-like YbhB/YbcL family protein